MTRAFFCYAFNFSFKSSQSGVDTSQTTIGHGSPFKREREVEKACGYRENSHIKTTTSSKKKKNQRKNVHFFYPVLFLLPFLLATSDAGFPCLSFKCHCVFKSNKLIADCIGLNAIPEVSKVPINSPFTCYFL